ncbi:MAG: imidazole glycerol phosphate synthase subunit HisH [Nitrosopumilus sp. H8]|nr:MAG: imidazole glycerol phosphate synthase subunit HisH [Nitrosopumilus sp. H13]RNJ78643.1 MAG: imidazole glycerol phosphate synthase subunit HisH [Nitrosopumilus sp. H8]
MSGVAIFDYGAGNIFSLKNSLERAGATVTVIEKLDGKNVYSGILLPGVGNFDPAMESVCRLGDRFREYVGSTPVLGICLGMEMFFERSEEGKMPGLGVLGGDVVVLPPSMKIPHMGWNNLEIKTPGCILQGVKSGSWAYFVHSYMARPAGDIVTAESDYGIRVPAVVESGNFFGTQFHPEKSGKTGQIMISNFLQECKR